MDLYPPTFTPTLTPTPTPIPTLHQVDLSILGVAIMVNVTVCVNLRFALEGHSFGKHSKALASSSK